MIGDEFFKNLEEKPGRRVFYRAEATNQFGINDAGEAIFGMVMKPYVPKGMVEPEYDFFREDIREAGTDMVVHVPEEGIKLGQVYEVKIVNQQTDWETGYVDQWDLRLVPYTEEANTKDDGQASK